MKQNYLFKSLFLLFALVVGSVNAWADDEPDWSYTIVSGDNSKLNTSDKTFTVDADHVWSYEGTTVKKGSPTVTMGTANSNVSLKFGSSGSVYFNPVVLSTEAFNDVAVKKVQLYLKHNGSKAGSLTVKQGDVTVGTATTSSTSNWIYVTCSETNKGEGGKLTITYEVEQALYINKIEVWYEELSTSDPAVATTVTIDASGLTNTNIHEGTDAGSLSATVAVKSTSAAIDGATVTWSTEDTDVATVDASGAVTLVAAGTATIKATYAGVENTYKSSFATYDLTVTNVDPNAPGSVNNPYTVAQALENTPSSGNSETVYIKGIVSSFYGETIVDDYSNRYYISDSGTTTSELLVYKGNGLNNVAFSSADDLLVGDEVVIVGQLTTYNSTKEVAQNNYIVSLKRKELVSIALSGEYQTEFVEGSTFNHDGMVVTATYNDASNADVTTQAVFSEPDMNTVGVQTVTVTFGGKSAEYTITITEAPQHTAYFSVNGQATQQNFKENAAIVFPTDDPADIEGKKFVGWAAETISGTVDEAPAFVTSAVMGTADVTFYAVFATASGSVSTLTDELTRATTGVTGTSYTSWKDKTATSDAVYAGNSAGGNEAIQLRSSNSSGFVSTTSGGKVKKVVITWNTSTSSGRTVSVYGSNTAYESASDLYGSNKGTLLGEANIDDATSYVSTIEVTGDYTFVGIRSKSNALYIDKISIDWQTGGITYSAYCTTVGDANCINTIQRSNAAEGEYFNLAGQRIAQPTKGLYIVNGKKVVVK